MSSTHTPGPWFFRETHMSPEDAAIAKKLGMKINTLTSDDAERIIMCNDGDFPRIALVAPRTRYKNRQGYGHECDERDANARLIAASPDLLAACRAASDLLGDLAAQLNPSGAPSETHLIPLGVRAQLEAALAKAEGGAE